MAMAKNIAVNMLTGDNPHGSPAEALAWATLEMAEQQRIANLIAFVSVQESQYREYVVHSSAIDESTMAASLGRHAEALRQIREGLGLS